MSFAAALRRATFGRRPIDALTGRDVIIGESRDDDPAQLAAAMAAAASISEGYGAAIVVPRSTLAFAVLDPAGPGLEAEQPLQSWLAARSEDGDLRRMVRNAARGGGELGVLADPLGEMAVVYVASGGLAGGWPLPASQRARLQVSPDWVMLAALTPTRASTLGQELEKLFDLSGVEARVVASFLNAPTVEIAAERLGLKASLAREALKRAKRKLGATNNGTLTRLIVNALLWGVAGVDAIQEADQVSDLLGLTLAESRVALLTAEGLSASAAASVLGVKVETVKSHLRTAFSKTGVNRSRALGRIALEIRAMNGVRRAAEVIAPQGHEEGRLRLVRDGGDRTVACIDYGGPADARALFVCHGFAAGRTLPKTLVELLHGSGWRPIVPQRPGFGLTDEALATSYFDTAADDMACIAASLRCDVVDVLARDSSAPALFALCARHHGLVDRAALLNPKSPRGFETEHKGVLVACSRFLVSNPDLIKPFVEMLRRQLRTDLLEKLLTRACQDSESDAAAICDPEVMRHLVTDIQALMARTSAGAACEQSAYGGWAPSRPAGAQRWAVGFSCELGFAPGPALWRSLLGVEPVGLKRGGYLVQFTHPEEVLALLRATSS